MKLMAISIGFDTTGYTRTDKEDSDETADR